MAWNREQLEEELRRNVPDLSNKDVWLWGAGDTAQLYQEGLNRLEEEKEGIVFSGYVDSDPLKAGKTFHEKPVISPEEMKNRKNACVLICSIQAKAVKEIGTILDRWEMEHYLLDEAILKLHREEVTQCYDLLHDSESKRIYAALIEARITGERPEPCGEIGTDYFALQAFREKDPEEVFVDCGAYTGDTMKRYMEVKEGIFKKYKGFELDGANYKRLVQEAKEQTKNGISEQAVELYHFGVSDKEAEGVFQHYEENDGIGSKVVAPAAKDGGNCKLVALDQFLTEPYTFLKADIESYEYRMLLGAKQGIMSYKPLLSICIYHNSVDLYSIPLLVKEMVPEYNVAVRHHAHDLSGTVLYAWMKKGSKR